MLPSTFPTFKWYSNLSAVQRNNRLEKRLTHKSHGFSKFFDTHLSGKRKTSRLLSLSLSAPLKQTNVGYIETTSTTQARNYRVAQPRNMMANEINQWWRPHYIFDRVFGRYTLHGLHGSETSLMLMLKVLKTLWEIGKWVNNLRGAWIQSDYCSSGTKCMDQHPPLIIKLMIYNGSPAAKSAITCFFMAPVISPGGWKSLTVIYHSQLEECNSGTSLWEWKYDHLQFGEKIANEVWKYV